MMINKIEIIGVVILNYNDAVTTIQLVDKIMHYSNISKIVIVDNHSSDSSVSILNEKYSTVEKIDLIVSEKNGGYGAGNNLGIAFLAEKYGIRYQIVCNPDVCFDNEIVSVLYDNIVSLESAALVAPMMFDKDGNPNYSCVWQVPNVWQYTVFSLGGISKLAQSFYYPEKCFFREDAWEVGCVAGSMFMMDVKRIGTVRPFEEKVFLYCEETILGIKVQNTGYKAYLVPKATFKHLHSVSISKSIPKELHRYRIMWNSRIFVLKNYMEANRFEIFVARLAKHLFILEKRLKYLMKRG